GLFPKPAVAVESPCFARAIALRQGERGLPALLLGADLLYVGVKERERVLPRIAEELGVPAERIMFTATHSHSAPGNFALGAAEALVCGRYREDVVEAVARALAGAAKDALAGLAPAAVKVERTGEARRYVNNRYWRRTVKAEPRPEAAGGAPSRAPSEADEEREVVERIVPVDGDLTVFWFLAPGGKARGLFAVFGAHATVIGPEVPRVSPDGPGGFSRSFEDARPGFVALYAAGPVGCQAPRPAARPGGDRGEDAFERARRMGEEVARIAAATEPASAACEPAPGFALRTVEVPLPPVWFRLAPSWRASPVLTRLVYPTPARAPLSILRLGGDVVVGFPCEISGQLSLEMKGDAARRGIRLTATSFAGAYHGYVPPDEYYPRWRYENRLSLHGPHFAAFLAALAGAATR
ncbi:MAG TPA: hypothetical protein VHF22_03360, partial [Planctomycetota bacterium]|nr:hypothetical protein [Planctomycetota bacterium]